MITPAFGLTATERVLPKLALDFTTASLDPRVTFTRTTGASNPATYVNSSGVITAATNNQPRFDYDPVTLACKGLLIEESRSNLLFDSSVAPWGFTNVYGDTITADVGVAPDGTTTADQISPRINVNSRLDKVFTLTSGVTYSITFYSKFSTGGSGTPFSLQTLVNATVVSNFVATDVGNGWYRQTASFTTSSTSVTIRLYWSASFATGTCLVWGAQLEAGAFATSYIPTTTTALTRNADVATMTGTNFSDWFNAAEGSFVGWAIPMTTNSTVRSPVCTISNGTASNIMTFGQATVAAGGTTLSYYVADGAVEQAYLTASGQAAANTLYKVSMSYKANSFNASFNGNTSVSDTSGTVPTVDQLVLGSGVSKLGNSWISKLFYYPMLTNAELQSFAK